MRKIKFSLLAVISSVILLSNISFSQDEDKYSYNDDEYNCLADKKWAVVFEAGTMLWNGGGAYKSFTLTGKHHFNKRNAVRFLIGTSGQEDDGSSYDNSYANGPLNYDVKTQNFNIETSLQYLYYLNPDSKVKLYISFGPYYYHDYSNNSKQTPEGINIFQTYSKIWGLGLACAFGVEYFILDNISLLGEYFVSGTIGKTNISYYHYYPDSGSLYFDYDNSTRYKFDANKMRLGFSVYF